MSCTTIIVGKKASYDGSTLIARNDDGHFDVKKLIVVTPDKQPKKYKSVIGHLEFDLPENPLSYTCCPSVDPKNGIWAAQGINSANVAMSATETTTTNALVMGADPYVFYVKGDRKQKEIIGGLGEEDFVTVVLPYIRSAREGVLRLGALLEQYGTYESNGIVFSDGDEAWWLETIGGHHWMAVRIKDDEVVIAPNWFGLDHFDFDDAYAEGKENLCCKDMKDFVEKNHLVTCGGQFNPRFAFGSHDDSDHVYNTPRSWYMGRYFCPTRYRWDGENADFTPESDNIPFAVVPEKSVTVEDVKYILSSHYQGTPYDPFGRDGNLQKGLYRPIGISRTGVMTILQIRGYMPEPLKAVEWICFGANPFNTAVPLYANTGKIPKFFSNVTTDADSNNFYWISRLIGAMADAHFGASVQLIERYQKAVSYRGHRIISEYDAKMTGSADYSLIEKANEELATMAKEEAQKTLNSVLTVASERMKCGYNRADN